MTTDQIRNWMGWYMLVLTGVLGSYILLAGNTWLLPLEPQDQSAAFEIIVPFLLAQVAAIFSYYGRVAGKPQNRAGTSGCLGGCWQFAQLLFAAGHGHNMTSSGRQLKSDFPTYAG